MVQGVLSGAGWFAVFLTLHFLWFHRVYVEQSFTLIVRMFVLGATGHLGTILLWNWHSSSNLGLIVAGFYGLLTMACLLILYMPFYYTLATSLSVQTLIFLAESPGQQLPITYLQQRFASRRLVDSRLKILTSNGYLAEARDKYHASRKGHLISVVFVFLKELWRLSPGG